MDGGNLVNLLCPVCSRVVCHERGRDGWMCVECGNIRSVGAAEKAEEARYIYLVNPPKKWIKPPLLDLEVRGLQYPRVIPLHALVSSKEYNDVIGKVRGKPLIELVLTVPTVRLRYKKREWTETEQFYLQIPFPLAVKLAEKVLRLSKKHIRTSRQKTKEGG